MVNSSPSVRCPVVVEERMTRGWFFLVRVVCLFVVAGRVPAYPGPQCRDLMSVQCAGPGEEGN